MSQIRYFAHTFHTSIAQAIRNVHLSTILPRIYARETMTHSADMSHALFVHQGNFDGAADFESVSTILKNNYGFTVEHISLGYGMVGLLDYWRRCRKLARTAARAGTIILNDACPSIACVSLRSETHVVQLWHACGAFKKWGVSTTNKEFGAPKTMRERFPAYANTSLVSVSSPAVIDRYIEAMALECTPCSVQALGVARTDKLLQPNFSSKARTIVEKKYPLCRSKKILLYAPTFRGHVLSAHAPAMLDIEELYHLLDNEWALLIRHHPFVKDPPAIPDTCIDFAWHVDSSLATAQLLGAADALVTDYSSLIFEYSLFKKPMLFFAFDLADYNAERGWYFDYENFVPGPIVSQTKELAEYVQHLEQKYDPQRVIDFRDTYMCSCDGNATSRICEWIAAHANPPTETAYAGSKAPDA